jgi:transcriptional regulator with XRE-family HTH domain
MAATRQKTQTGIKSVYRRENAVFLEALRTARERAGLTQGELAEKLGRSQSYITSIERATARADGVQTFDWLHACGSNLVEWAREIEAALATLHQPSVKKRAAKPKAKPKTKSKAAPRKKMTNTTTKAKSKIGR